MAAPIMSKYYLAYIVSLLTLSYSFAAGSLWPDMRPNRHATQLTTGGYFYGFNDSIYYGRSSFTWPHGTDVNNNPVLDYDGDLWIILSLSWGYPYPYAGLKAFIKEDTSEVEDFSTQQGFCATLSTNVTGLRFELHSPNYGQNNFDVHTMNIPNTNGMYTVINFPFKSLLQEGWGDNKPIDNIISAINSIAIIYKVSPGKMAQVSIRQLGFLGECDDSIQIPPPRLPPPPPPPPPVGSLWPHIKSDSLGAQLSKGGFISGFNDSAEGGTSIYTWPRGVNAQGHPKLDVNGFLTAVLETNNGINSPYTGIQIDIKQLVSESTGFCATIATYRSGINFELQLSKLGTSKNYPYLEIPNTHGAPIVMNFKYGNLKQNGTALTPINTQDSISGIAFKFNASAYEVNQITLYQLGYLNECTLNGVPASSLTIQNSNSNLSNITLRLADRSVIFDGLSKQNTTIQVLDLLGKKVHQTQLNSTNSKLNLSHLKNGVYIVRAVSPGSKFTQKIMIK